MLLPIIAALTLAALQPPPPPPRPPPIAPTATPATNAWLDANIQDSGGWQPVARNNNGMTLVLWPAKRGDPFNIEIRTERMTPVSIMGPDGAPHQVRSWMTNYSGGCRMSAQVAPGARERPHLQFTAQQGLAYSGQNLTGESIPMPTPMTLEAPEPLFNALCRELNKTQLKEAAGPADLMAPTVAAWMKSTLDIKGWQAPGMEDDGVLLLSEKHAKTGQIRSADVRREYFEPRFFQAGVLARSTLAPVDFDCTAKTATATAETLYAERNLRGGADIKVLGPRAVQDFPSELLWKAFGDVVCASA